MFKLLASHQNGIVHWADMHHRMHAAARAWRRDASCRSLRNGRQASQTVHRRLTARSAADFNEWSEAGEAICGAHRSIW